MTLKMAERRNIQKGHKLTKWAVVVAQLVEWSLPMSEIWNLNPDIGNFYLLSTVLNVC